MKTLLISLLALLLCLTLGTSLAACGVGTEDETQGGNDTPSGDGTQGGNDTPSGDATQAGDDTPGAIDILGISEYLGMTADCPYTLTFTPNGDGTCTLTRVDVNVLAEYAITLTIPATSPAGDTVTKIDTQNLCLIPPCLSDEDFRALTDPVKSDDFTYKRLTSYFYLSQNGVDLWAYDPFTSLSDRVWTSVTLEKYNPSADAVAMYGYLLNLKKTADAAGVTLPTELSDFDAGGRRIEVIELPDTLTSVNYKAFAACSSLKEIRTTMTEAAFRSVNWAEGFAVEDPSDLFAVLFTYNTPVESVHVTCSDSSFDLRATK